MHGQQCPIVSAKDISVWRSEDLFLMMYVCTYMSGHA